MRAQFTSSGVSGAGSVIVAIAILLSVSGCVGGDEGVAAAEGALIETGHCAVAGIGALPTGESFYGSVHDEGGTPTGAWSHTTSDDDQLLGDPDWLFCRINGATFADFSGTGTWNGVPGHSFYVNVQDRGEPGPLVRVPGPSSTVTLEATRWYRPTRWEDGEVTFSEDTVVRIPETLPVTVGNAGNGTASLTFTTDGETIRCDYRGGASRINPTRSSDLARGREYVFVGCETVGLDVCEDDDDHHHHGHHGHGHGHGHHGHHGHGHGHDHHGDCDDDDDDGHHGHGHGHCRHGDDHRGHGRGHDRDDECDCDCDCVEEDPAADLIPGSEIESTEVVLHVENGSNRLPTHRAPRTTVSVDLTVTPYVLRPSSSDFYLIEVRDPGGALVHTSEGDLVDGDIEVTLLD